MRFSTIAAAAAMACMCAVGAADAAYVSIPAMAGHGWPTHNDTCFSSSWNLMQNNCAGTVGSQRLLIIPVQHASDNPQTQTTYNAHAIAQGNGSNTGTNCQGISSWMSDTYWSVNMTQIVSTSTSSARQMLMLGNLNIYGGSLFHFECFVAQGGGVVHAVRYL
jgi:hypothetical protein